MCIYDLYSVVARHHERRWIIGGSIRGRYGPMASGKSRRLVRWFNAQLRDSIHASGHVAIPNHDYSGGWLQPFYFFRQQKRNDGLIFLCIQVFFEILLA